MSIYCKMDDLVTESDVEQKFLYQFLTEGYPLGCSYIPTYILTKHNIKPYVIGKSKQTYYFPDYIIKFDGVPIMVIEAKRPGIDVYAAFAEARLYANELNAKFSHNINPCKKIVVSNGEKTLAGYYDQEIPIIDICFEDFVVGNIKFAELLEFASYNTLNEYYKKIIKKVKGEARFSRPVGQIGGKRAQNSELKENNFGRIISLDYNNILIPESEDEYKDIVKNAYVESKRREQHVEPILKTIRSIKLPSVDDATYISSEDASPLFGGIEGYIQDKNRKHSLILLIGSVGSGKSTFIRYLKYMVVSRQTDLVNKTEWLVINMNNAPISRETIYDWLIDAVLKKIKEHFSECDFGEKEFLLKLYSHEIKEFENGIGDFISADQKLYYQELYQLVKCAMQDKKLTLLRLIEFININKRKECIIVLDNVDQGAPQDQLLMFQVAEWFRNQFRCLIILPMRDTTYNIHRTVPPLDTVVKELVFRIDPPDLLTVLQLRLKYIYRLNKADNRNIYTLENGMNVVVDKNEYIEYFKNVLNSIRKDNLVKNIFYSITGRDTRSGIELFIDFCKSGHLSSREIFTINATGGEYVIPNYIMMNAILRGNRHYYSDIDSRIKNLFASEYNDDWVDPFIRVDILRWLDKFKNNIGPNGTKGFYKSGSMIEDLSSLGHSEEVVIRELRYLIRSKLILSENTNEEVDTNDLIRISQYGSLHIHLLNNITYLAACSEDVLYKNTEIIKNISDRITGKIGDGYLSKTTVIHNVEDMLDYLKDYKSQYISRPNDIINIINFEMYDLEECYHALTQAKSNASSLLSIEEKIKKFPEGTILECMVISLKEYGIFITLDFVEEGFIPGSKLLGYHPYDFEITDIVLARVVAYREKHKRFELEFIEKI